MKYYSEKLNKIYDDEESLKEAEKQLDEENEKRAKLVEVKKARASEVEEAYLEYQKVKEEAYKKIADAEKKWLDLRDKFAQDYKGYHMTYVNKNGKKYVTFGDFIDSFFNW